MRRRLFLYIVAMTFSLPLLSTAAQETNETTEAVPDGMDFLIISTSTTEQQSYWESQLNNLRGSLIKPAAYVVVVHEQWPGGAGSGFGTFYAYQQAQIEAKKRFNLDLIDFQSQGNSIGMYHTSGQGKRMSPLTASEKNNKSAIKLPSNLPFAKDNTLSILEAVIWQSSSLAPVRKGKLSVFWGDQVFLPKSVSVEESQHEINIFSKGRPMPSRTEWQSDNLDKYGFFALDPNGMNCYLEKATFNTVEQLIADNKIAPDQKVSISLGSFCLSTEMIIAMIEEFTPELNAKNEMMNVEHSLWMPLTLDLATYCMFMESIGWTKERASEHHKRLSNFKERFFDKYPDKKSSLLGVSDIGADGYWWDYGTIENYFQCIQKLTQRGDESNRMREFYSIPKQASTVLSSSLRIDATSVVLGSSIESGSITNSILIGVTAKSLNMDSSIAISSSFNVLKAQNSLYYNVIEEKELVAEPNAVRADLILKSILERLKIRTQLGRDGKNDWDVRLEGNPYSYAELEQLNLQEAN